MAKTASALLFCVFVFLGTGCNVFRSRSSVSVPSGTPPVTEGSPQEKTEKETPKENKERIKTKTQIMKVIGSLRNELKKAEVLFANKRAEGKDASKAEEIWENSENLLKEAERLYLEANLTENYEPVLGLLQAIENSLEKIKEEIKKAPRFREETKPRPKEYMDDRDIIVEKIGHIDPTHIQVGPMFRFSFIITDPTENLSRNCFDGRDYILQYH